MSRLPIDQALLDMAELAATHDQTKAWNHVRSYIDYLEGQIFELEQVRKDSESTG